METRRKEDWEAFLGECKRITLTQAYHDDWTDRVLDLDPNVYFLRFSHPSYKNRTFYGEIIWISQNRYQLFRFNVVVLVETGAIVELVLSCNYFVYASDDGWRRYSSG